MAEGGEVGREEDAEEEEEEVEEQRGGPTTRWQSCKVLRVTPGYVMLLRPCVGRSHVFSVPWLHRALYVCHG